MGLSETQKMDRSEYLEKNLEVTECSQRKPYVFISYASDDWETVFKSAVVPMQKKYGLRVYADKAFDKVNDKWIVPMLRNIRGADMIVAFISQSYIESYACFLELLTAVNNRKQIVFVSLGDQLRLGDTTDQPMIERGAKNEILNQGANISTNTNNTSNDIMRAMKSAYTSLSTLLEQDALSKYDISDAFINFFRDASVSRKTINDLGAVQRTIKSVSKEVFDKEKAAKAERKTAPVQPSEPRHVQEEKPSSVQMPEQGSVEAKEPIVSVPEQKPMQTEEAQPSEQKPVQEKEAASVQVTEQKPERVPFPARTTEPEADFSFSENEKKAKKPLNVKLIAGGVAAVVVIALVIVFGVLGGTKNVTDMAYTSPSGKTGTYTGEWKKDQPEGYGTFNCEDNGNIYEGEWVDGNLNGQGTCTTSGGDVFEGEYKDGQPNGEGTLTYANGDVYKGEWSNGYKHGQGTMTYANGDVYEGGWSNDKWNGQGIRTLAKGDVNEGEWKNGSFVSGHGTYTNDSGNSYDGEMKGSNPDGQGTMKYENGDEYTGEWGNGKRNGQGTMTYANGDVYTGEWKDNIMVSGHATYTNSDGNSYDGEVMHKESGSYAPNGQGTMKYANGDFYEGEWKEGVIEGQGTAKYENGDVYTGEFSNGKRNGQGTMTYADGRVYEGEWEDSIMISGRAKYTNDSGNSYDGEVKRKEDGGYTPHGKGKLTYADGGSYEGEFVDGKKNGKGVFTKADGTVVEENWDNGTKLE